LVRRWFTDATLCQKRSDTKIKLTISSLDDSTVSFQIEGRSATKTRDAQAFIYNMPRHENARQESQIRQMAKNAVAETPSEV
jgi:hypothetical protein